MEERAASLAAQAAQAEGLEGTVDEVVARQGSPCDPHSVFLCFFHLVTWRSSSWDDGSFTGTAQV